MSKIYENTDGAIIAEFGTGAIGVGGCFDPDSHTIKGLTLWELEEAVEEIGNRVLNKPTPCDELNEKIRLEFTSVKSVDVVIGHLMGIKHCLEHGDSVDGYDKAKTVYFENHNL